ncbi:MAG: molybdenum cofactor guanylyltransferase [Chloroflexi bacterium]|nr:molybdenum cofactor guanylyltransferase [Chloroflexota bacterium]
MSLNMSAVILAGGQSRRMGRDKALIDFGGKPLVRRIVDLLMPLSDDVILVTNQFDPYNSWPVRLIADVIPGKGSLGGIYSGLIAARYSKSIIVACDMPYLNPRLIVYLAGLIEGYDVVMPQAPAKLKGQTAKTAGESTAKSADLHPMHAVYAKTCLPGILQSILADDLRLISFLPCVKTRFVGPAEISPLDPEFRSFINVNTPEEFEEARQYLL